VWFYDNIVTRLIGGALLLYGWSCIKVGIWGSQKLIDEMTLDGGVELSKGAAQDWNESQRKWNE
jgi:hypothetical protein